MPESSAERNAIGTISRPTPSMRTRPPRRSGRTNRRRAAGLSRREENARNLLYLKPLQKRFMAGFALGEKAVQAAEQSNLPDSVVEMIRRAPEYPEGRAVRVEVKTAADVKIAKRLLAIKMEN